VESGSARYRLIGANIGPVAVHLSAFIWDNARFVSVLEPIASRDSAVSRRQTEQLSSTTVVLLKQCSARVGQSTMAGKCDFGTSSPICNIQKSCLHALSDAHPRQSRNVSETPSFRSSRSLEFYGVDGDLHQSEVICCLAPAESPVGAPKSIVANAAFGPIMT
jgi:hypothetical protein